MKITNTYKTVIDGVEYTVSVLPSQFNKKSKKSELVSTRYNGKTSNIR